MRSPRILILMLSLSVGRVFVAGQEPDTSLFRSPIDSSFALPVYRFTQSRLRSFPFRGLQNYLSIVPGIVSQNGSLFIRGSRAGEIGYFVDGFSVTNPFFNSNGVELIPEAMEVLEMSTGAFGVQFGRANGGIIHSRMRTGSDSLEFSIDFQSDNAVRTGDEFFNTTSFGYDNIVGTVGGPLLPRVKFFLAGQYTYLGNRQPMFLEPFRYDSLRDDGLYYYPNKGKPLPGSVEFRRNFLDYNWSSSTTIQGNATIDLDDISVYVIGSYSRDSWPDGGSWPDALTNYFRLERSMVNETKTRFFGVRLSHNLSSWLTYKLSLSTYDRFYHHYDPDFGDDWRSYTDSLANVRKGYSGFISRYNGPRPYSTIYYFNFLDPNSPNTTYNKDRQSLLSLTFDFTACFHPDWELTAGGEVHSWEFRFFLLPSLSSYLTSPVQSNDYYQRAALIHYARVNNYGYDVYGNEANDGYDAPRKPRFTSFFANNKFSGDNLTLDLGLRCEIFDLRLPVPLEKPGQPFEYYVDQNAYNYNLYDLIDENKFLEESAIALLLPRFSLNYNSSKDLSVYAAYGNYAQMTPLSNLMMGNVLLGERVLPVSRSPYAGTRGPYIGFYARPERATQYEVGVQQRLNDHFWISFRTYYKNLKDQLQLGRVYDDKNVPMFATLLNNGEGIDKGAELTFELTASPRFSFLLNYALSDSRGTSSSPTWNWYDASDAPVLPTPNRLYPFDYDQTHRGSLLVNLHFPQEDGDLLGGLSITSLASFNSGHRYTRSAEIQNLGSFSVWTIGVRPIQDPRFSDPIGEWNTATTPWVFSLDVRVSKELNLPFGNLELYVNVLNALNTQNVLNVYPTTGTPNDDSWFNSPFAQNYLAAPGYEQFYRTINLQNRWAFIKYAGYDIYSSPRQIRFGVKVQM